MDAIYKDNINQKAKEHLLAYIDQVSPYFDIFFAGQKEVAKKIAPVALDMVERYEDFIGGKRLRGYLTKFGYELFGGENTEDILKASMISEIIHGFGLVHDDIMDEDELRRNKPTMHIQFQQLHKEKYADSKRNEKLYGTSMAINVGDLGPFYANLIINDTKFSSDLKMKFLRKLSEVVIQTVHGQGLDVSYEQYNVPSEERVMEIHKFKTSFYTIPGPMQYGAVLTGVSEDDSRFKAIESYGIPVGIAFQMRDDELGMFSTPQKFGKPIYSDLRQGKNTVLFSKAFEKANPAQLKVLESMHGNPNVNDDDLKIVNEILIATGAVDYSQKLCRELVSEGKKYISKITDNKEHQQMLDVIADYVVTRNS